MNKLLSPAALEILKDMLADRPAVDVSNWLYKVNNRAGLLQPFQLIHRGQLHLLKKIWEDELCVQSRTMSMIGHL